MIKTVKTPFHKYFFESSAEIIDWEGNKHYSCVTVYILLIFTSVQGPQKKSTSI